MEMRARLLGQRLRARRVLVGHCEKTHRRMLGGEPRPQRADAARADDRDADVRLFHGGVSKSDSLMVRSLAKRGVSNHGPRMRAALLALVAHPSRRVAARRSS